MLISLYLHVFIYISYGVYVSRLFRFSRASCYVADFDTRGGLLTRKLLKQGCRCHGLRKAFSGFYGRCCGLISNSKLGLDLSCARGFRSLVSVVAWCVGWGGLLALVVFRRGSLK